MEEVEELHVSDAAGIRCGRPSRRQPSRTIADHRFASRSVMDLAALANCLSLPGLHCHSVDGRPDHRHAAVPGRRRADPDLRRAEGHQFHPRLLLHARRLFRADHLPAHRQLHADHPGRGRGDRARRPRVRAPVHQPRLRPERPDAASGLLRLRPHLRRRGEDRLGGRVQVDGHAAGVPDATAVHRRRRGAAVLSVPDRRGVRDRPGAVAGHRQDASRQDHPRRRPQSEHGRRARHQHRLPLRPGVRARRAVGRVRRGAGRAGALADPGHGFLHPDRVLHRHRHRRHGLDRRSVRGLARARPYPLVRQPWAFPCSPTG